MRGVPEGTDKSPLVPALVDRLRDAAASGAGAAMEQAKRDMRLVKSWAGISDKWNGWFSGAFGALGGAAALVACVRTHGGGSVELATLAASCLGDLCKDLMTDLPRASEPAVLASGAAAALLECMSAHAGARGLETDALRVIGRAAAAGLSEVLSAEAATLILAAL